MAPDERPFWRRKSLREMTDSEWESLCDGCGRCCLVKLEDADDSSRTYFTDVGCRLLDGETCRCHDYPEPHRQGAGLRPLSPRNINRVVWLPPTCAYRRAGRRARPLLVAPARLRRSRDGAPSRNLGARPGGRARGRRCGRRTRGPHRELAGPHPTAARRKPR